jgi:molybdopterin-guanine dinucleotide biosynthesis protein A
MAQPTSTTAASPATLRDRAIPPVAGVILAGGRSSRMGGGDKSLLLLDDRTVLSHVVARLRPQVRVLALNANGDPGRFEACGLPIVADAAGGPQGPLAGILAGMRWAATLGGISHVATVPADTPFFPGDLVAVLWARTAAAPDRIAVAVSGGRTHPPVALWPIALAADLAEFLAEGSTRKVAAFVERHRPAVQTFAGDDGMDPFFNINTPADLVEAKRILRKQ